MTILVDTYSKKKLKTLYLKPEIIDIIPQIYIHSPLFVAENKNAKQKKHTPPSSLKSTIILKMVKLLLEDDFYPY